MSKSKNVPSYRCQRQRGRPDRAFVELSPGHRVYLGEWGSASSRAEYARALARWEASGRCSPVPSADVRIVELVARYMDHVAEYHRGREAEIRHVKSALTPLLELFGSDTVASFGPKRLQVVRQKLIDRGWCRRRVNEQTHRLRRLFRWGTAQELVSPGVLQALESVEGLRIGKTEAPDHPPVLPVDDAAVDATLPYLTPTLRAMVTLLRLTGQRPGELFIMRPCDIDRDADPWTYKPASHKSQHRGRERVVFLGPEARTILEPFLLLAGNPEASVFSPARSVQEHRDRLREQRVTPESCGNVPGSHVKARPSKTPGDRYNRTNFGHAIRRACSRAFPEPDDLKPGDRREWRRSHWWTAYQLRHAFATRVRSLYGLESCQVALGHAHARVSEIYGERDASKAREVARKIG